MLHDSWLRPWFVFCGVLWIGIAANSPARAQWRVNGLPVCNDQGNQSLPAIVPNGFFGAIIAWDDFRDGAGNGNIYAQNLDSTGTAQWMAGGLPVCTASGSQYTCKSIMDGAGGGLFAWEDRRASPSTTDLYIQRLNSFGVPQWTSNGIPLCTAASTQSEIAIVADRGSAVFSDYGAIVAWRDNRSFVATDIYVQHVGATAGDLWAPDGVALCTATNTQRDPVIATDGLGLSFAQRGAFVAWVDQRPSTHTDIYARRVDASGIVQWASNGVAVCSAAGNQFAPEIVLVGGGLAIIVWEDHRGSAPTGDIYAQKLDSNGSMLWTGNGVPLCTNAEYQLAPVIALNAAGGAFVAWGDRRNDSMASDIYAQMIDANGVPQWTGDGIPVCMEAGTQVPEAILYDNAGGAIVTWSDYRSGSESNLYAQRLNSSGQALWAAGGVRVCGSEGHQLRSRMVLTTGSRAIVAWEDSRDFGSDIYASRVFDPTIVDAVPDAFGNFRLAFSTSNPGRGGASLGLELPRAASVAVQIFDPRGRIVRALWESKRLPMGSHSLIWDGKNDAGAAVSPGVYFLRAKAGEQSRVVKLVQLH